MEKLIQIIAQTYSQKASRDFMAYKPTQSDLIELAEVGHDVLQHFPSMPGACGAMTALFVARWEMKSRPTIYMVAGELFSNKTRVFGHDSIANTIHEEIAKSGSSWDGHFWVVFGPYIVDVSIFRTAYSKYSPPALTTQVLDIFGTGKGFLIANSIDLKAMGFRYIPHAVLTKDQVTAFCHGAKILLDS